MARQALGSLSRVERDLIDDLRIELAELAVERPRYQMIARARISSGHRQTQPIRLEGRRP
jgi:hypothetical protein